MAELLTLHGEVDRLFGELSGGRGGGDGRATARQAVLPVDIERSDDALLVHASVPGFKPEEVRVTVGDGVLTVEAERATDREQRESTSMRRERFRGRLFRQVALGKGLRGDEAEAHVDNGVLTVRVPRVPAVEPRRIPVQVVAA